MDYNGISQLDIFLSKTSSFEWFFNLVSSVKRLSRAEGSPDDATDRESIEAFGTKASSGADQNGGFNGKPWENHP